MSHEPCGLGKLELPDTCLPKWDVAELPEPKPLSWRNWKSFLGPGIVMMGVQIGGGEWLFGPEVTARFGAGMMWAATVAIVLQVFYNLECGRYALYCGEPIFTGFMRMPPGPRFWIGIFMLLSVGVILPGLTFQAATVAASLWLDRPPTEADRTLVMAVAYGCLALVIAPVLFGGKIYNTLQWIMAAKVFVVLGFCLAMGVLLVGVDRWLEVFSGFVKFGSIPVSNSAGEERLVNSFTHFWATGSWPVISLANIAVLGGFVGYAGGGGLGNSLYSNYVRDKGWGMGSQVGAIPSAIGGKHVALSHLGKVFPLHDESLSRWRGWWKYLIADQVFVWAPGCFVGMGLPALLSLEFSPHSPLYQQKDQLTWTQAVISADGARRFADPLFGWGDFLWTAMLIVGLTVLLPSQMSVVEDVCRRWTDVIWSSSRRVRTRMYDHQVRYIYYSILAAYGCWCVVSLYLFSRFSTPKLMTMVIANLNNVALGTTSFMLLWVNCRLLPKPLRPRWYQSLGVFCCGFFSLFLAGLVFAHLALQWLGGK